MSSSNPSEKPEPSSGPSLKDEIQRHKRRTKYLHAIITVAADWLHNKPEAAPYLNYLNKRIDPKDHNTFNFGYFPNDVRNIYEFMDDLHQLLPQIDPKIILAETGIVEFGKRKSKIFYYNNPLLIPYYDVYGNPISIVGRTILPDEEMKDKKIVKYKNLPFHRSQHLFGFNLSRYNMLKKDFGIIIEGQFDMISSYLAGLDNVAALCGSKIGTDHILLLKRYTKNLGFLLDNDEAGEKGWKAIQTKASKYDIVVIKLTIPSQYKDVDEFIKKDKNAIRYIVKQFHLK